MLRRLTSGLASLVVLLALLVGIPVALILLAGNPFPEGLMGTLMAATRPDYGGQLLIGTLLPLVGWGAWTYLAISVVVEAISMIREGRLQPRPARRSSGAFNPGRALASTLLSAIAIMIGGTAIAGPAMAAEVAPQVQSVSIYEQTADEVPATATQDEETAPAVEQAAQRGPVVTVNAGDSLWSLAQTHLGQGERYSEIAELNIGVPQADGRALGADLWLSPGWEIELPADAATTAPTPESVQLQEGQTLYQVAETYLGDGDRYPEIAAASGIVDADDISAGTTLTMPTPAASDAQQNAPQTAPETAPEEAAPSTPEAAAPVETPAPVPAAPVAPAAPATTAPAPTSTASASTDAADDVESAAQVEDDVDEENNVLQVVGGIGGLLAAGLVSWLGARRLMQLRRRKIGQRIAMPTGEDEQIERELRATAAPHTLDDVDRALRALAVWAQDGDGELPSIYALRLAPEEIALYLETPLELPAPFRAVSEDSMAWTVDPSEITLDRTPAAPYPALVTLGQDATDAHLLVDLERLGALNIHSGDDDLAHGALTALTVELATSRWAEDLQITLVGLARGLPVQLQTGRVRHVDDVTTLIRNLEGQAASTLATLHELGVESIDQARGLNPDADAWVPEIVILGEELSDEHQARLTELVTQLPRVGIAAVAKGQLAGGWRFDLASSTSSHLTLPGDQGSIELKPQVLSREDYERILNLIQATEADAVDGPAWAKHLDEHSETLLTVPGAIAAPELEPAEEAPQDEWDQIIRDIVPRVSTTGAPITTPEAAPASVASPRPIATDEQPLDEAAAQLLASLKAQPWMQLLGPVRLHNAKGEEPVNTKTGKPNQGTIARAHELIAFLCTRPVATSVEIHDALWPGNPPDGSKASNTRNSLTARARKMLGYAPDGAPYLPRGTVNAYQLHKDVTSDWQVLQELIGENIAQTPTVRLQAAFEFVQGKPFADVPDRRYGWAEAVRMDMLATIDDLGHVLFQRHLAADNLAQAREVAARARSIGSLNEINWRDSLLAEQRAGDADGFERIVTQLQTNLDDIEDGYEPEPETQELIIRGRELLKH